MKDWIKIVENIKGWVSWFFKVLYLVVMHYVCKFKEHLYVWDGGKISSKGVFTHWKCERCEGDLWCTTPPKERKYR